MSRLMLAYLGQITGRKEPLDLAEAIRETLPLPDVLIPQKVHLKTELPDQATIILADAVHIKHVVTSLVTTPSKPSPKMRGLSLWQWK